MIVNNRTRRPIPTIDNVNEVMDLYNMKFRSVRDEKYKGFPSYSPVFFIGEKEVGGFELPVQYVWEKCLEEDFYRDGLKTTVRTAVSLQKYDCWKEANALEKKERLI